MKVKKTYRLDEQLVIDLEKYADENDMTATAVIESAVRKVVQSYQQGTDGGQPSKTLAALLEQLAEKDKQIAALLEQLAAAQEVSAAVAETAKAAQALHAATVGELAPTSEKAGRWARLKAAWRG